MKSLTAALLAAGAAMMASAAEAGTRPGFELQAELFDQSYRERQDGNVVVKEDGVFGRGGVSYVETIGGGAFLRARLDVAIGSADYLGGEAAFDAAPLQSRIDGIPQGIGQLELHAGKDFVLSGGAVVTPFVGLGSRYLQDRSGGKVSDDGLLGYDREVGYGYVPLGLATQFALGRGSAVRLSGQYNWVVSGDVTSKFSGMDPGLPDVKVDLGGGNGFEFSALVSLPAGRHAIAFGPFIRHWNIDQSASFILRDPEGGPEAIEFFEPRNRTTELGLRLAFSF